MTDITDILVSLITVIFSICIIAITGNLIPAIKAKMSDIQWANLLSWAKVWVKAAEVLIKGSGLGEQKRDMVLGKLSELCTVNGYSYDEDELRACLENAVTDMKKEIATKVGEV